MIWLSEQIDCNNCPTINLLVSNYDKLYELHKITLYVLAILALGKEIVSMVMQFIK